MSKETLKIMISLCLMQLCVSAEWQPNAPKGLAKAIKIGRATLARFDRVPVRGSAETVIDFFSDAGGRLLELANESIA